MPITALLLQSLVNVAISLDPGADVFALTPQALPAVVDQRAFAANAPSAGPIQYLTEASLASGIDSTQGQPLQPVNGSSYASNRPRGNNAKAVR